jgi:uncharacterized membrane protein YdjX (TVP38/TMEM64 family)
MSRAEQPARTRSASRWIRPAILLAIIAAMALASWQWSDQISLDSLVRRQAEFQTALRERPFLVILAAFAAYVTITTLFVGSATAISLLYGWLFGVVLGTVLVSFASTAAATVTFLASRYLFRGYYERRFGAWMRRVDHSFARDGVWYLLSLRLIPGIPFFLVNAAMGLTPIRLRTYWWVSQLGMLPATIIFLYAGASVPDLKTVQEQGVSSFISWKTVLALTLLGLLPLAIRIRIKRVRHL